LNGDGTVTVADLNLMQLFLTGQIPATAINLCNADMNGDGEITWEDFWILADMLGVDGSSVLAA